MKARQQEKTAEYDAVAGGSTLKILKALKKTFNAPAVKLDMDMARLLDKEKNFDFAPLTDMEKDIEFYSSKLIDSKNINLVRLGQSVLSENSYEALKAEKIKLSQEGDKLKTQIDSFIKDTCKQMDHLLQQVEEKKLAPEMVKAPLALLSKERERLERALDKIKDESTKLSQKMHSLLDKIAKAAFAATGVEVTKAPTYQGREL